MNSASWRSWIPWVEKAAWAFFLVALPVTSFPFFPPAMGGGALVRPLSLYPLILLTLLFVLPRLFTKPLPRTLIPLLPFIAVALAASLLSLLRGIEPAHGIPVADRILRAVITLAIGCAIYLAAALLPRSQEDLRFSLRWLYAGFGLALFWGSLQAVYIVRFSQSWYKLLSKLQTYISTRRLIHNRVSGLTYEPNWFAEQITVLLLPWLLASVLNNSSVFRWRWRRITVEWVLLIWSIVLLPFTFSRAGVANLAVLALVSVLFLRPHHPQKASAPRPFRSRLVRRLVESGLAVAVLASLVYFAGTKNEFFARIWGYWAERRNPSISDYFEYLGFGARFTYGETAFRIYESSPVLGVGLGNYAFYFEDMLPERPLAYTPEVLRLITPEEGRNRLITAKNFYFRLLAETGLVGTAVFMAFLIAVLGAALYLWLSPDREEKFWGTGGLLGLIAFALSALSFDSFAIPNMWVVLGLITAASWIFSHTPAEGAQAAGPAHSTPEANNMIGEYP